MAKLSEGNTISMIGEVTDKGQEKSGTGTSPVCSPARGGAETPLIIARHKNGSRRIGISLAE